MFSDKGPIAMFGSRPMQPAIQLDMFDVQLGAAILMQFRLADAAGTEQIVRVMADAGDYKPRRQPPIDVLKKKLQLPNGGPSSVWTGFSTVQPRLDLIIGTHYDADHLGGLVPIIDEHAWVIDEIWLPPVQSDKRQDPHGRLLVQQLLDDQDGTVLTRYLDARAERIREVRRVQGLLHENVDVSKALAGEFGEPLHLADAQDKALEPFLDDLLRADRILARARAVEQFGPEHRIAPEDDGNRTHAHSHGDEEHDADAHDRLQAQLREFGPWRRWPRWHDIAEMSHGYLRRRRSDVEAARLDMLTLETIVKASASEAITAKSLDAVVQAIKRRPPTMRIRVRCEAIDAGRPRYFRWTGRRFDEQATPCDDTGLGFHLMGPSRGLIAQLHARLPIEKLLLVRALDPLASDSVTPSNRLSYVMRFHSGMQRILVSGDAGFTDFRPDWRKPFYPHLLALLSRVDVIQIAHHGGLNHRFYRALDQAGQHRQSEPSFLLLSHATHDASRPQKQFGNYLSTFQGQGKPSVLFTATPRPGNLTPVIRAATAPVTPAGTQAPEGDVQLAYVSSTGQGGGWVLQKHAVGV